MNDIKFIYELVWPDPTSSKVRDTWKELILGTYWHSVTSHLKFGNADQLKRKNICN